MSAFSRRERRTSLASEPFLALPCDSRPTARPLRGWSTFSMTIRETLPDGPETAEAAQLSSPDHNVAHRRFRFRRLEDLLYGVSGRADSLVLHARLLDRFDQRTCRPPELVFRRSAPVARLRAHRDSCPGRTRLPPRISEKSSRTRPLASWMHFHYLRCMRVLIDGDEDWFHAD